MMAEKAIYEMKGAGKQRVAMLVLAAFLLAMAVGCFVFTEEGRQAVLVFGFVCLFLGGTCLDVGIGMNRCWLKVYETYIEGQSFTMGLRKNVFHFSAEQIESVHQVNGAVSIKAGAVHTVMCKDPEAVFQVLSQCKKQAAKC